MNDLEKLSQLASEEAVLKALLDAVGDRLKDVKADMQAALDEVRSVRQVSALLPDGTEIAKISLTDPKPEAVVTDPDAFLAWVRENAATEVVRRVEVVTEVRPAYRTALLAQMTAAGRPEICDKETGVVDTVPGVEIKATRARSHSVRFGKTGKQAVAAAWQAGQLLSVALPQLTAGEPDRCPPCPDPNGPWDANGRCEDCTEPQA
ncbi:hypothetical protein [Streptomyces sp. NPDC059708]|uniref:hypothetical protein n=1 Tax=Streptomyces sp. NPDC059708 TaxID=3346916 RepID=UPI0036A10E22